MADELEFVCEKCVHYEVCDRSSRMIWARLSKEKVCTDFMEVVRCKDCKKGHSDLAPNGGVWCAKWNHVFGDDGFCSCGERKGE